MPCMVDSCGWLHVFKGSELADQYRSILQQANSGTLVASISLYEVSRVLRRDAGELVAMECALRMQQETVVELTSPLALEAADVAAAHGLAMADAIIYATARRHGALLYTSDADLEGLPGVEFIPFPPWQEPPGQ